MIWIDILLSILFIGFLVGFSSMVIILLIGTLRKEKYPEIRKLGKEELKEWYKELAKQELGEEEPLPEEDSELSEASGYESSAVMDLEDEEEEDE